jgi:S-formylglutathione hydrolase FrmB
MKTRFLLLILFITACIHSSQGATVDSISVASQAMKKDITCVVIKPGSYEQPAGTQKRYPVLYLLHGYSGKYSNWIIRVPELTEMADREELIIVCPDGGYSGWYWDSPMDPSSQYETYIAKEVPTEIDRRYRTVTHRNGRAITGLSMGGHGGIYLGFRHSDFFGACGSMSGAVDLSYSINKYEITKRIGDTVAHLKNWYTYSAIAAVDRTPEQPLSVIIDCGTEDHLIQGNRNLHQKMLERKIPHDYIERPGKHDWNYWRNAVTYQLLFFSRFFRQNLNNKKNQ